MIHIERILCPIDFSEFSARAYDYAQSLARHYQANLFLNHIVDFGIPPYEYYTPAVDYNELFQKLCADARDHLQEFAKSHTRNGVHPECFVQEGGVTDSILSFAEAQMVDLIVMGTHGLKGLDRVTLGSVAEKVLRKACCPVLVVRKAGHDFIGPGSTQESDPVAQDHLLYGFFRPFEPGVGICALGNNGVRRRAHPAPRIGEHARFGRH